MATYVGKIQELYDKNNRKLYGSPSPYTENSGIFSFGPRQPFVYTKINDSKSFFNKAKRFENRVIPFASSLLDTKRIAKFMVTGNGLIFLTKQFFLQKNQPFNETRLYNPLSPLLAASTRVNPFSDRYPSRFIDTSGGPMGMLKSAIGLPNKTVPAPPGTVGLGALSTKNKSSAKGLLRAHTAINGYSRLDQSSKAGGSSFLASLKSLFSFKPQKQPANASFRSDEGAYGIQLKPGAGKFDYFDKDGSPVKWGEDYYMRFEAGKKNGNAKENIRKKGETSFTTSNRNNRLLRIFGKNIPRSSTYYGESLGYEEREFNGYIRYGQNVGADRIKSEGGEPTYKFSEILSIYRTYASIDKSVKSESKFNDATQKSVKDIEEGLKRIVNGINSAGYKYFPLNDDDIMVKQFSNKSFMGMDNISSLTKDPNAKSTAENYNGSYGRDVRDNKYHVDRKKGFAGSYRSDKVNSLTILSKNGATFKTAKSRLSNDPESDDLYDDVAEYNPYRDDQIAFYFHDIVNDNYIPFRATIKGLSEQLSANWSDVNYIGRADKIANYTGFTRTINFSFSVTANSLKELLPMWVRINYLATLVKPSKYSSQLRMKRGNEPIFDDFIVPPMTAITIGDMYKEHPFLLKTVSITIPEDALWETVAENDNSVDWSYLNGKIVYEDSKYKGIYAQFPRECDITVAGDLLERVQPRAGGSNFGGIESLNTAGNFSKRMTTIL
jgi:hypothetical protein